jgi:hypothetical protein
MVHMGIRQLLVQRSMPNATFNEVLNATKEGRMPANIFYIIGVVVVVLFILGYLGLS